MPGPRSTQKPWFVQVAPGLAHIRCGYRRRGTQVEQFVVHLEISIEGVWQPVVRYDNAHGFCLRDTLHADGTQDKTPVFIGDLNETFTHAIEELRVHWEAHRTRYMAERKP